MSVITLSNTERIKGLKQLRYTEREASFLCLAALHGGYFLYRQYNNFIGKEIGGNAFALIEKLAANDHASVSAGWKNTKIYHLSSRPFYAALGEQDNRNRRERAPEIIKNKLMGLDFVLESPDQRFLATEREKVDYFTTQRSVNLAELPSKKYSSPLTGSTTERFFVDKYPLFLSAPDGKTGEGLVSFCYVDEGLSSGSRFDSYLHQYKRLFMALDSFQVIYVAASDKMFELSERTFVKFLREANKRGNETPIAPLTPRIRQYFEARKLYEAKELASFDRDKLIRLRNDRERFSGPKYEALYQSWKDSLGMPEVQNSSPPVAPAPQLHGRFSTHLLLHNYDVFARAPRAVEGLGRAATTENGPR